MIGSDQFRASVATATITPTESMWLAGFAVRTEPSKGKINDLYAKALAIEDQSGNRIVIASVDLIAISKDVASKVTAEVERRCKLPRSNLLLCATHTHYGPELRPDKVPFFHIPPEFAAKIQPFADRLTQILIDLIVDSLNRLQTAKLSTAQGTSDLAMNRRLGEDPTDRDVPVLVVSTNGDRPLAILFGYACHNTTMPPTDCLCSGDWSGFACEMLQERFPGSTALFLAGAGADQNPNPKGPVEVSRGHGRAMAQAVVDAIRNMKPVVGSIRAAFDEIPLEYQPIPSRETLEDDSKSDDQPRQTKARFLLEHLNAGQSFPASYPCPVQAIRIGEDFLLIAIGGEPVIDYAVNLKKEFGRPNRLVWVAGYANDMFGYVATPRVLKAGGYEGTRSVLWSALPMPFTESVEQRVLSGIHRLLQEEIKLTTDEH